MKSLLQVGDIDVEVVRKDIKNVHLSVHPPKGRVTVAAPAYMKLENIRLFVIAKVVWIREQQKRLQLRMMMGPCPQRRQQRSRLAGQSPTWRGPGYQLPLWHLIHR